MRSFDALQKRDRPHEFQVARPVHVIDVASARIVKNVEGGKPTRRMAIAPVGIAFTPDGKLGAEVAEKRCEATR